MKYYIRLNKDDNLKSEAVHAVVVHKNDAIITDDVTFPMPRERVYVREFELVGEDGVVYAARRIPPDCPFVPFMDKDMQLSFHWKLHITMEGFNHFKQEEDDAG